MTKELAIKLLRGSVLGTNEQQHEAIFMAIRALKAEPVMHGRWIEDEYGIPHCSECKAINNTVYRNYCPNCGAKMDEKE